MADCWPYLSESIFPRMRRVITLALSLAFGQLVFGQLDPYQSYIVTMDGDSIYCRYLYDENPTKLIFQNRISPDEHKISRKDVKCYRRVYATGQIINHSFVFRRMPIDPGNPRGRTALMQELIDNKGNSLWKYDRDPHISFYFVYNKGMFKGEINQKDHINELVKYFGECSRDILESEEFNKYFSFSYVRFSEIYNKICLE